MKKFRCLCHLSLFAIPKGSFKHEKAIYGVYFGKYDRAASAAALAAERQGKFWPLHDLLFENYNKLNPQKIRELVEQAGLDMARFDQERNDPALQQRSMPGFKQMIEAELAKVTAAKKQTVGG